MEKMILSLKNIYMTLMTEDFPIYSESVIGRAERKGQTMLRFWQNQIAEEFRYLPCGQRIWRRDGKRNRYTSYICNRSAEIKTYSEYVKELSSQVSTAAMLNQIGKFSEFLTSRKYQHDILLRRIQELMRLTETEDPRVTKEIEDQITAAVSWRPESIPGSCFQAAYLLTVLMLYAAAGEAMDDPAMGVLRSKEYALDTLWNTYKKQSQQEASAVTFLTVHSGLLQDNPLPKHRFFGREEELFDLMEMAAEKQKCLITGIGGIGKTELLRQLICRCVEEHTVDKIAIVTYEKGIVESFARAFPDFRQSRPEDRFLMILRRLRKESEQGKLLLLIDNLTNGEMADPDLAQLLSLDCAVLITARHSILEGFEVCHLDNPTIRTGALIFRDNFGHRLDRADQEALTEMLSDEALCHPLTLRLLARAASRKNWSVQELKDQLQENGLTFSWQEEHEIRMTQLYRQLYSYLQLSKEYHTLAELFTLLPRNSYSAPFLCRYFPDIAGSEEALREKLDTMCDGGWLETDETGWSMHPLIAQCLRRRIRPESRVLPTLHTIRHTLDQQYHFNPTRQTGDEYQRICQVFVYAMELLTGPISPELMKSILRAILGLEINRKASGQYLQMLGHWLKRCHCQDDEIRVMYCAVQGCWHGGTAADFLGVYEQQKPNPTVSAELLRTFCYFAGESLIYQQEYALAETLLKESLCDDDTVTHKAASYYLLSICTELWGNAEGYLNWSDLGADYVKRHPECGEDLAFHMNSVACTAYTKFGMHAQARELLQWLAQQIESRTNQADVAQFEITAGTYELNFGDPEASLAHYQKALSQDEVFWEDDPNHIQILGQMAIALQRLKRYEEALEIYQNMLHDPNVSGSERMLHICSNNISVVYLELNRPKDALKHLEVAMVQARQYGGIALGETQRNRARAYGQLGRTAKERECLTEAVPLLEEAYGADHPRASASRQRLEELTKK